MTRPATSEDCLREAFAAILRGDTQERDRLAERATRLMAAEKHADAVQRVMEVDFYVTGAGHIVPTALMLKQAGVVQ